jgi:hypothetical protein
MRRCPMMRGLDVEVTNGVGDFLGDLTLPLFAANLLASR